MQTTYNFNPNVGTVGMIADMSEGTLVRSKLAQSLVPVGLLAYPGTDSEVGPSPTSASTASANPGQVIAWPASVSDSPLLLWEMAGIPIYDSSRPPYDSSNNYSDQDPCPVLVRGAIWVKPEATFSDEKRNVYVRTTASGLLTTLGGFAGSSGTGLVLAAGNSLKWLSGCNANGLAILGINVAL